MWKILLFRFFRIPVVGISNGRMQALYSHVETFKNFTLIITFLLFSESMFTNTIASIFLRKVGVTMHSIIQ